MPRWTEPPKHPYSPARLAYLREANRKHRAKLRGGRPPLSVAESAARATAAAAEKKREQREQRERENAMTKPEATRYMTAGSAESRPPPTAE
jgi:hypothetical protein